MFYTKKVLVIQKKAVPLRRKLKMNLWGIVKHLVLVNHNMTTTAQYPQVQINITLEDINALAYVKTLLKQMKGVRSVKVGTLPKVSMTEEEYYQKIDRSIANAKEGPRYVMNANESGAEFLQRLVREAQ